MSIEGGLPRDSNVQETSVLSNMTDEGLDLSQKISESIFQGPELDADGEELLAGTLNTHFPVYLVPII